MPFEIKNFGMSSVGLGDIPNRFSYLTEDDDLATVLGTDYFLKAADLVDEGDTIYVKSTATIPFDIAEYNVRAIVLNADGIPTSIAIEPFITPGSSGVALPVVESPAFDTTDTIYMAVGAPGTVIGARAVLNGTNTTTPVQLDFTINGGGISGGTIVFGATDPAGTLQTQSFSAPNTVVPGDLLEVTTSGGGAAVTATITYIIT